MVIRLVLADVRVAWRPRVKALHEAIGGAALGQEKGRQQGVAGRASRREAEGVHPDGPASNEGAIIFWTVRSGDATGRQQGGDEIRGGAVADVSEDEEDIDGLAGVDGVV